MKRVSIISLVVVALVASAGTVIQAATLATLTTQLRERTGDRRDSYADSSAAYWLNMGQFSIANLTGTLEREWTAPYVGDLYTPPSDIRAIKTVKIFAEGRWFDMGLYADSGTVPFHLVWDSTSPKLYLDDGGFIPAQWDVTWSTDSLSYALPDGYRRKIGVVRLSGGTIWRSIYENPFFINDTSGTSYFIAWSRADTARLYVQSGGAPPAGDVIRIFYLRGLTAGDSVQLVYAAAPMPMVDSSSECQLHDNLEIYVVEEAARYYNQEIKMDQQAALIWQQIRQDLGFQLQRK